MESKTKVIDLNQRRKFKKHRKWFELYAKFLSLFKRKVKRKKIKHNYKTKNRTIK